MNYYLISGTSRGVGDALARKLLDPVDPMDSVSNSEIANNIRINLTAMMVLSSVFIRLAEGYQCSKTIVNISSGAGKQPYDGWGPYCAAKAGVAMFTRCLAEEQQGRSRPVKVLSIAPGVVDTDMQRRVREIDESLSRQKVKFLRLKGTGASQRCGCRSLEHGLRTGAVAVPAARNELYIRANQGE